MLAKLELAKYGLNILYAEEKRYEKLKGLEFDGNKSSSAEDKPGEFVAVYCCGYKVIKLFSIFEDYITQINTEQQYNVQDFLIYNKID